MERKQITGVVFSDLGRGSSFMSLDWVQMALREKLGFSPYAGTMNLRLESEEDVEIWREHQRRLPGIDIDSPEPSFCQARCFLVEIESQQKGAVLVPGVESYPPDKIEVIAPVRLKDELQLTDGDRVTLEFVD
jgi:CTP-dependent riboflavin kinase